MIFDAHLDLAFNAVCGRDLTQPLPQPLGDETAMVNFAALREAGVRACLGTIWAYPASEDHADGYITPAEARGLGLQQLEQYLRWQDQGQVKLLHSGKEVLDHWDSHTPDSPLGVVLLMEGADPIRDPEDLAFWVKEGLRAVGLAWERTRYSGGTNAPGGLTPAGVELTHAMREQGIVLDVSHLAEQAFWEATEIQPTAMASHCNARAIVNTDRQLSDAMLGRLAELDGRVGLVVFNNFIKAGFHKGMPKDDVTFQHLMLQAQHIAGIIGWDKLGLGSDLDGGFGLERTPAELHQLKDLHHFFGLLPAEVQQKVQHQNWLDWLGKNL